jgi:Rrf2 family protein
MFSTSFRYALISLLELAEADQPLQAHRIARKFALSPHYLAVVLRDLRRLGLIESQKGNRGGYRLRDQALSTNLLELHRSLTGAPAQPEGAFGDADRWLREVADRWMADLAATTLADLRRGGS